MKKNKVNVEANVKGKGIVVFGNVYLSSYSHRVIAVSGVVIASVPFVIFISIAAYHKYSTLDKLSTFIADVKIATESDRRSENNESVQSLIDRYRDKGRISRKNFLLDRGNLNEHQVEKYFEYLDNVNILDDKISMLFVYHFGDHISKEEKDFMVNWERNFLKK